MVSLRRACGLETEYALVYAPSIFDRRTLDARRIYDELERLLRERGPTVTAEGHKTGIFLENGALVSFEAQTLRHGLLEISTPECASAMQAVLWQSALDDMLVDLLPDLHARLADKGCYGLVTIGKNSTDHRGNYYGTHENYEVRLPWRGNRLALGAALIAFEVLFLLLDVPLGVLVLFTALLAGLPLLALAACTGTHPRDLLDDVPGGMVWTRGARATLRALADEPVRLWCLLHKRVTRPFAALYSIFAERTLLATLSADLTGYFLTRVIWCGSGAMGDDGRFRLMQRAPDTASLAPALRTRCLFDLKAATPHALWALHDRKRLHVTYSDSNISERCVHLKLGVTGLLLGMIEAGHRFEGVQAARPWSALQEIADDPDLHAPVEMREGPSVTALELQWRYWHQARAFYAACDDESARIVLADWKSVLEDLERDPRRLAGTIDWIAKRDLMARVPRGPVVPHATEVAAALRRAGVSPDASADRVRDALPLRLRRALAARGQAWPELARAAMACMRLRKIDLKFHELSDDGYGRRVLGRISDRRSRLRARLAAPRETRAAARAALVRDASASARMKWDGFYDPERGVRVSLPDALSVTP